MMMKKSTVAATMLLLLCAHANAETNTGSGTVNFTGAIIDAPCSIAPESVDQTVDLGQIANKTLELNGEGTPQNFNIKLEGCDTTTAQSVDVTFNGAADDAAKNQLQLQGLAKGAAIEMKNLENGDVIELGQATSFPGLMDGTNTLRFNAKLVRTTVADPTEPTSKAFAEIIPGDFTATSDFVLSYQ